MKSLQYGLSEINLIAARLLSEVKGHNILVLVGPLGAGKTTLATAMLEVLGFKGEVTSPTFSYVNIYHLSDGRTVYHFDLYRLKNVAEFEQLGFFEYLDQPNSLVFIEWPEILLPILQDKILLLRLSAIDQERRNVEIGL